ncbi:MAG: hypothetical protein JWQ37_3562 [Blastococcus sp.]|nr:hypothetical protein [Blastococcus sp.]
MLDGVTSLDGTGSVITVPVNDGEAGTVGSNLIAVTLPVALPGGTGTGGSTDSSTPAGGTTSATTPPHPRRKASAVGPAVTPAVR